MKAAVKQEPRPGITLTTVPEPTCGPNQIILRIAAAAICGTDLHIYKWDETGRHHARRLPVILGHEFMGEIVEIGGSVTGFRIGQRVAADPAFTCGVCMACRTGQFNLCDHREVIGIDHNGAFSQYAVVNPALLYDLPDEVSDEEGAFLETFGVGVHAVEKAGLKPGDTAVVIGAGPIGLSTLVCAQAAGARKTYLIERHSPVRLNAAKELGAEAAIDADEADPVKAILDLTGGQRVDVVFEASGSPVALQQAVSLTRKGGQIVAIGTPPQNNAEIPLLPLILQEISLIGIRGRNHMTWLRAINLIKNVTVAPIIGPVVSLDDIDEAFRKAINREVIKIIIRPN
jgi:threonine dehydrogenase-like Zn-dependent dehydrogenase